MKKTRKILVRQWVSGGVANALSFLLSLSWSFFFYRSRYHLPTYLTRYNRSFFRHVLKSESFNVLLGIFWEVMKWIQLFLFGNIQFLWLVIPMTPSKSKRDKINEFMHTTRKKTYIRHCFETSQIMQNVNFFLSLSPFRLSWKIEIKKREFTHK